MHYLVGQRLTFVTCLPENFTYTENAVIGSLNYSDIPYKEICQILVQIILSYYCNDICCYLRQIMTYFQASHNLELSAANYAIFGLTMINLS